MRRRSGGPDGRARPLSLGMLDNLKDGWRLGGAALGFVLGNRALQRFVLGAIVIVLAISAGVAVAAVALRREAGPVGYALVGLAAYYCLSVMVTAVAVGVAGLVADSLESRPVTPSTGWQVIARRRRSIAGWALVDLVAGVPSRAIGSWTVDQLGVLLIGFGWGLLSFFAIPTIALTGASPLATARHSLRLVRSRWGDAVYSTVYLWVRAGVVFGLPAAAAVVAGVLLIRRGAVITGGALFAAGVAGLALAYLLIQIARAVLTVVLYRYAESGTVYSAFPAELLDRGLRGPSSILRRLAQRIEGDRIRRLRQRLLGDVEEPRGDQAPLVGADHPVEVRSDPGRADTVRIMTTTEAASAGVVGGLSTWRDGPAKQAIVEFVARVCGEDGSEPVPVEERLAVFDNDGTLWCEKPMPIQLDFILRRLVEMAEADAALRERQPWKAAYERDYGWLSAVVAEHYAGDEANVKVLGAGILAAFAGISVEDFEARADEFLRSAPHPVLGRRYLDCAYAPMVELLAYLAANGFSNYIASGGGRDFMRPISQELYGIPRQRVIGSSAALAYTSDERGGTITHKPEADYLDDGPEKPIRIWSRTGRRPLLAAGNSNGDVPMLHFTQHQDKPFLRLLVLHDDAEREFAYTTGAEQALDQAASDGWTVISVKNDWVAVF